MKELSIEEKAKRYDEAIKAAKSLCKITTSLSMKEYMESIFPELRESEDDRIINNIKRAAESYWSDEPLQEILDWLEKQCEQKQWDSVKPVSAEDKLYLMSDEQKPAEEYNITGIGSKNAQGKLGEMIKRKLEIEKQCEQKPAEKVEPKFKVGDWVVYCNEDVDLITGIKENGYCINNGGYIPFICASDIRLWTIEDAKDGDVLAEDSCIFIIQKLGDNSTAAKTYCTLYNDGDFDDGSILYFDIDSTKPATKEQRVLLFQKIKEAGYEWDVEKKELKKIHVIDEGKAEMDYCFTKMMNGEKVSSAWSEEDEKYWSIVIAEFSKCAGKSVSKDEWMRCNDWLNSLRNRVQPQNTWKPSERQKEALLWCVVHLGGADKQTLGELLEALNKL